MTIEQLEHEQPKTLEGQLQLPNERTHLFSNHAALCDFVKTFNILNYTVHYGMLQTTGEHVVQLTYTPVNN